MTDAQAIIEAARMQAAATLTAAVMAKTKFAIGDARSDIQHEAIDIYWLVLGSLTKDS